MQCDAFAPATLNPREPLPNAAHLVSVAQNLENLETGTELATFVLRAAIMAQSRSPAQRPLLTQEQLKKKLEVTNFDPNAILRGAQLTVVGGLYLMASLNDNY